MFSWLRAFISRTKPYPPGPEGVTIYAIGDIHGRSDCLAGAHALIDRDMALREGRDQVMEIYIGDYFDRGPDSRGVIDLLLERSTRKRTIFLRGNHEVIMESFLRGEISFEVWRIVGGLETTLSYGVDSRSLMIRHGTIRPSDLAAKLPDSHRRFFLKMEDFRVFGRYCFAHAGIRPGISIDRQSIDDLAWIRDDFLNFSGDYGFVVVHGHTPNREIEFLPNRVNIDTGAYATNRLSVIRIDADGLSVVENPPT